MQNPYPVMLHALAVLCVSGCDNKANEFEGTQSIKVMYTIAQQQKVLTVSDSKRVKELVDLFQLKSREKGVHFGNVPMGTVTFALKGGAAVELYFVSEKTLEEEEGRIDLKDKRFYDKINKILSDKEGRKIDILKDN